MSDDLDDALTDELTLYERVATYCRAGMRIFPVESCPSDKNRDKSPLQGYLWKERATSSLNEAIEDFTLAAQVWDEDNVMIAWALGLDGYLAIDMDIPAGDWPDWVAEIIDHCAINVTKRGQHLIAKFPAGAEPGNSTDGFPTAGWGEVRGAGGYIVIAGGDRPGFDTDDLELAQPFPRPGWLTEYTGGAEPVSRAEAKALVELTKGSHIRSEQLWKGVLSQNDPKQWDAKRNGGPEGRHPTMIGHVTTIAEEALQGHYPYGKAMEVVKKWFEAVKPDVDTKTFTDACRWGIDKALKNLGYQSLDEWGDALAEWHEAIDNEIDFVDLEPYLDGTYEPITPNLAEMTDGRCLLYRERLNIIWGPSGGGKSWLAAKIAAQEIEAGRHVGWIELEDTPQPLAERLLQMNVDRDAILEHLHVIVWPGLSMMDDEVMERVLTLLERSHVEHVFVDSLGEAFANEGINEDSDAEASRWLHQVGHAIPYRLGAGVTLIDHITKSADNPLYPSGTKRKRATITGAGWLVAGGKPFTREEPGHVELTCGKDRHGHYPAGTRVGQLALEWDSIEGCVVELRPTTSVEAPEVDDHRWSGSVLEALRHRGGTMSITQVYTEIHDVQKQKIGKDSVRGALESLVAQGLAKEGTGERNSRIFWATESTEST